MIEKRLKDFVTDAIKSIYPLATPSFMTGDTYASLKWKSEDLTKPTEDEWNTALAKVQSDWEAQEYARNRQADYPDIGSQLNKIYDDGVTKWKSEMVDPVKAKWPKDNSGPK